MAKPIKKNYYGITIGGGGRGGGQKVPPPTVSDRVKPEVKIKPPVIGLKQNNRKMCLCGKLKSQAEKCINIDNRCY